MFDIIYIMVLVGLLKLLIETENPLLCSGIYAGVYFLFGLMLEHPFQSLLLHTVISFALATIYFWLLNKIEFGTLPWWLIMAVGLLIGLV